MSFTPIIIIDRDALESAVDYGFDPELEWTERDLNDTDRARRELMEWLKSARNAGSETVFRGIRLLVIEPELTRINKIVRELLDELEIEYAISN